MTDLGLDPADAAPPLGVVASLPLLAAGATAAGAWVGVAAALAALWLDAPGHAAAILVAPAALVADVLEGSAGRRDRDP